VEPSVQQVAGREFTTITNKSKNVYRWVNIAQEEVAQVYNYKGGNPK
jgi:hypothetical protein